MDDQGRKRRRERRKKIGVGLLQRRMKKTAQQKMKKLVRLPGQ